MPRRLHVTRTETLGLLSSFRKALALEVANNDSLRRDLEVQVFAFLDQLAESQEGRSFGGEEEVVVLPAPVEVVAEAMG